MIRVCSVLFSGRHVANGNKVATEFTFMICLCLGPWKPLSMRRCSPCMRCLSSNPVCLVRSRHRSRHASHGPRGRIWPVAAQMASADLKCLRVTQLPGKKCREPHCAPALPATWSLQTRGREP